MREVLTPGAQPYAPRKRDIETIESELRLGAALRSAARERGWAAAVDSSGGRPTG